ncbi:MAG: hypothetical protein ACI3X9_09740 [Bacteroidaceae bacterium]
MKESFIATLKGCFDSSLHVLLDTAHTVGEVLDMSNITHIVPNGYDYYAFFRDYVAFCKCNGSKLFRIDSIRHAGDGFVLEVSPV